MKTIKKATSILLLLVILLGMLPTSVFATTVVASGYCGGEGDGTNLSWTLDSDGTLTISGTGAMQSFNQEGLPWEECKTAFIGDNVTTIGNNAFFWCYNLTTVSIGKSVTNIGSGAFECCRSLTAVSIPDNVTTIGDWAFDSCWSLTAADIPSSVTTIGRGAFRCSNLTTVEIPSSVTTIGSWAFSGCDNLTEAYFTGNAPLLEGSSHFPEDTTLYYTTDTTGWTDSSDYNEAIRTWKGYKIAVWEAPPCVVASGYCGGEGAGTNLIWKLTDTGTLIISGSGAMDSYNPITSNTDYQPWHSIKNQIKTVIIGDGITNIGRCAFYFCKSLTNVSIPNSVKSIDDFAFEFCTNLKELTIPSSVRSLGYQSLSDCSQLKEVVIPDSVTNVDMGVFSGCSSLRDITIGRGITTITNSMFSGCSSLKQITIPNNITAVSYYAFSNCTNLTDIIIPENVTSFGDYAFKGCISLKGIYFKGNPPGCVNASVHYHSFPLEATLYYNPAKTAWLDQGAASGTWKGYKVSTWDPSAIPEGKYAIIMQDSKGDALEGVTVTWNNETAVTSKEGIVSFRKFTEGEPVITAAKAGYVPYSNENSNYKKSNKGYDIITLYTLEEGVYKLSSAYFMHKNENTDVLGGTKRLSLSNSITFSLQCGIADTTAVNYKLIQGSAIKAESTDGLFSNLKTEDFSADEPMLVSVTDASGLICKTPINLQFVDGKPIDKNSIKLGGEALSLTLDENVPFLGGKQLKFDMPYTPIDVYISGDTVHLGINVDITDEDHDSSEKKIQKLKGLIGTIQHMQKTETQSGHSIGKTLQSEINFLMKDKNQKAKWGPVDASLSFIGYGEGKFDENGLAKIKAYMCLTGSVSTTLSGPTFVLLVVPVTYSITFSAKGELAAEFEYDLNTQTDSGDLALIITPGLKAFGGVGIGKAVGAGAYGSAELPIEIQLMGSSIGPGVNYVDLTGELGLKAYLGPWTYEYPWKYKTWHLYTRTGYSKQTPMLLKAASAASDLTDESQYYLEDLSYLENQSEWLGYGGGISLFSVTSDTTTANELTPLQIGTYRNMRPVIGAAGKTPVMVWVTANTERGDYNYPQLVYSVFDNGIWCEPMPVDDNDTLDSAHTLYTADDDTLWLIYQDTMEGYNTADLSDFAACQTIRAARFDESTGAFTDFVTLSEPGVFSRTPVIAEQDGIITALWVANTDNNYFGENTTNTLCYAQYEDGTWSEVQVLASGLNAVTETAIGIYNGSLSAAVITDGDNDLSTTDDRSLWLYDGMEQAEEIATGSVSAVVFAALPGTQDTDLLWSDGISLMAQDTGAVLENPSLSGGFTVLSDRILYNGAGGENNSNLFAQIYNDGTWTAPVHVTVQEQYLQSYAAIEIGGQTYLAAAQAVVDITADSVDETCTLSWAVLSGRTDAAITAVDVDYSAEAPGAEVPVYVDVVNLGDTTISEYTVTIGTEVSETVTTALAPGEETTVELALPLGETVANTDYEITITTDGDEDETNDTSTVTIGHTDFTVNTEFLQAGENRAMLVKVANEGAVSAGGMLTVASESGETKTITIDTLEPGAFSLYRVEVTSDLLGGENAGLVTASVTPNATEWNQLNNQSTSYVETYVPTPESTTTIEKTSMVLGNDLSIMFAFTADGIVGTDNYATITKTYADGTADRVERIEQSAWGDPIVIGGKNYYAVSFDGVAAKEMTDEVQVQIFNGAGTPISEVYTDSIRDYAMRMIESGTNVQMFVDMLVYGAEAQKQFNDYGGADLATAELTEAQLSQATSSVTYENKLAADDGYRASSLILESNIQLAMLFGGIDQSMTAQVSFTDHYGNTNTYTVNGSAFEPVTYKGETCYSITVDKLVMADARQLVSVVVKDSDGKIVTSATDSVESYIARMSDTGSLYEAIMKFSDSAAAGLKS